MTLKLCCAIGANERLGACHLANVLRTMNSKVVTNVEKFIVGPVTIVVGIVAIQQTGNLITAKIVHNSASFAKKLCANTAISILQFFCVKTADRRSFIMNGALMDQLNVRIANKF